MYRIISEEELKRKLISSSESIENNKGLTNYLMPKIDSPWPAICNKNIDENKMNVLNEYVLKYSNVFDDKVREHLMKSLEGESALWYYPLTEKHRIINKVNLWNFLTLVDNHEECNWGEAYDVNKSIPYWTNFSNIFVSDDQDLSSLMPKYFLKTKIIFNRICEDLSEKQKQIFRETFVNWTLVCRYKETSNKNMKILDFGTQMENRVFNGAMVFNLLLIEYEMNIDLTDFERSHALMIEYCHELLKNFVYVNDLYSFRKEYIHANGDLSLMSNMVSTLINYHKLDINTAVLLMKAKIEECHYNCNRIKREILASTDLYGLNIKQDRNGHNI